MVYTRVGYFSLFLFYVDAVSNYGGAGSNIPIDIAKRFAGRISFREQKFDTKFEVLLEMNVSHRLI